MRNRVLVSLGVLIVLSACGGGGSGVGEGAPASKAERTIDIRQLDEKKFDPSTVTVKKGETVTFRVTNTADEMHEFVLGDEDTQKDHDKQMAGMPMESMKMADVANRITMEPGETKELTWKFPDKATTVIYGCHMPGHYAAGMKGTIKVT